MGGGVMTLRLVCLGSLIAEGEGIVSKSRPETLTEGVVGLRGIAERFSCRYQSKIW